MLFPKSWVGVCFQGAWTCLSEPTAAPCFFQECIVEARYKAGNLEPGRVRAVSSSLRAAQSRQVRRVLLAADHVYERSFQTRGRTSFLACSHPSPSTSPKTEKKHLHVLIRVNEVFAALRKAHQVSWTGCIWKIWEVCSGSTAWQGAPWNYPYTNVILLWCRASARELKLCSDEPHRWTPQMNPKKHKALIPQTSFKSFTVISRLLKLETPWLRLGCVRQQLWISYRCGSLTGVDHLQPLVVAMGLLCINDLPESLSAFLGREEQEWAEQRAGPGEY